MAGWLQLILLLVLLQPATSFKSVLSIQSTSGFKSLERCVEHPDVMCGLGQDGEEAHYSYCQDKFVFMALSSLVRSCGRPCVPTNSRRLIRLKGNAPRSFDGRAFEFSNRLPFGTCLTKPVKFIYYTARVDSLNKLLHHYIIRMA